MIDPEIGHHLLQLALGINLPDQLGLLEFVGNHVSRDRQSTKNFPFLGREIRQQPLPLIGAQMSGKSIRRSGA